MRLDAHCDKNKHITVMVHSWKDERKQRLQQSSNQVPLLYFLSLSPRQTRDIFTNVWYRSSAPLHAHCALVFSLSLPLPLALRHSHTLAHSCMHKNKHRSTHSHDSITSLSFLLTSAVSYLSNKLKKVWEISRGLELKNVRSDVRGTAGWVEEMERVHAEWRGDPETV